MPNALRLSAAPITTQTPDAELAMRGAHGDERAFEAIMRRHNQLLNYLLHRQLRMVSLISGLRRMLQHWPEDAVDPAPMLAAVLRELGQGGLRQAAHCPPDGALRGPFGG